MNELDRMLEIAGIILEGKQNSWDVLLKGKVIDTVFFDKSMDANEVQKSLIDHDNYDSAIKVKKGKK